MLAPRNRNGSICSVCPSPETYAGGDFTESYAGSSLSLAASTSLRPLRSTDGPLVHTSPPPDKEARLNSDIGLSNRWRRSASSSGSRCAGATCKQPQSIGRAGRNNERGVMYRVCRTIRYRANRAKNRSPFAAKLSAMTMITWAAVVVRPSAQSQSDKTNR